MHVEVEDIYFRYGSMEEWVLEAFSHVFPCGIQLIKGYSGCGKSTLLRMIAGYLTPAEGIIRVPSESGFPDECYQRENLGFVFQQLNLLPLATVARNLELSGSISGISGEKLSSNVKKWTELLGLGDLVNRLPTTLSGGQQQRATIARALIKEPKVILLDEPTSGLDDLNTRIIMKALKEYVGKQRICIISTHDSRLEEYSDEIVDFNRFLPMERHLVSMV